MLTTTLIGLAMESGSTLHIEAVVCGQWAAHAQVNDWREPPTFNITHVPSGRCLRSNADEATAIAVLPKLSAVRISKMSKRAGSRVKRIIKAAGFNMWKRGQ